MLNRMFKLLTRAAVTLQRSIKVNTKQNGEGVYFEAIKVLQAMTMICRDEERQCISKYWFKPGVRKTAQLSPYLHLWLYYTRKLFMPN